MSRSILSFGRPGLFLLGKVDLVVDRRVVVPILLARHRIADTQEKSLGLQVRHIGQVNGKIEAIEAIVDVLAAHVMIVLCRHFRHRLPIVQSEASQHVLLESQVSNDNDANQALLIWRQVDAFQANRLSSSSRRICREVGQLDFPLVGGALVERILCGTRVRLDRRGIGAHGEGLVKLQEMPDVFELSVKVDVL